jgi:penicillin-insensitive murein endopeptidase
MRRLSSEHRHSTGRGSKAYGLLLAALLALPSFTFAAERGEVATTPYPGPARSIGRAANGCLAGAVALPLTGPGWETLRPKRNRFWGNPALIAFIEDVAGKSAAMGRLLVADMAQPRGGHMVSGHGSHQTGVDVDILYRLADHPLTEQERSAPALDSVVASDGLLLSAFWGPNQTALVRAFASDPRVERIFVNPAIKRALCRAARRDRDWLRKLRPWWGHDEHFHVRINCPVGDSDCVGGAAIPPGDGCGAEVDSWMKSGDWRARPKPSKGPVVHPPPIPEACKAILGTD